MSINRATLDGYLGADPTIRTSAAGAKVATFRIATSERWKDRQTGEQKERSQWHSIVVFADWLIEVVEKKLKKGARVFIEGAIETRDWDDDAGVKRYTTEIVVRNGGSIILPVDMPRSDRNRAPPPKDHRASSRATTDDPRTMQRPAGASAPPLDDDIPF